jgi:hypothetical protein
MPREQHEKRINELQGRHQDALKKLTNLQAVNLELWRHKWITTPQQLQFLGSLIEQLEASLMAASAAHQNLHMALEVVIEANKQS